MPERGFTVVELIITMVVIAVILTLGVMSLQGVQANARDSERKSDIEVIARGLEARYAKDNTKATGSASSDCVSGSDNSACLRRGQYPGAAEFLHAKGTAQGPFTQTPPTGGYMSELLEGSSLAALTPPSATNAFDTICSSAASTDPCGVTITDTVINTKLNQGSSIDRYLYVPYNANNQTCYAVGCVGYNLYWKNEEGVRQGPLKSRHR